mgnify:CR=1 FL=1
MARKKGLPFVVQPRLEPIIERVGTETSGIIEIQRKGYLTVSEKALVQGASTGDTSVRQMFALAGRIGREEGRQQTEVAQDILKSPMPDYLSKYEEEIGECVMNMLEFQERTTLIQATALLICRVDNGWTVEQSMELHPDLLDGLARLYMDEESKSIDLLEKASTEGGAAEGKE